jgi:integrase
MAEAIEGPCVYQQETLPAGPSWEEVRRLGASFESERPCDLRNRALVLLLATYGLRAGEVCALRLDDLDWRKRQIVVRRSKQRRSQVYPLVSTVALAIGRYLKSARPECPWRELFVTLRAPIHPITRGCIGQMLAGRIQRLGIQTPHRGPHALRHACASHLLTDGFSLKEIGDHLGHRSPQSTAIYAKVDLLGLREVAAFDLGGLL